MNQCGMLKPVIELALASNAPSPVKTQVRDIRFHNSLCITKASIFRVLCLSFDFVFVFYPACFSLPPLLGILRFRRSCTRKSNKSRSVGESACSRTPSDLQIKWIINFTFSNDITKQRTFIVPRTSASNASSLSYNGPDRCCRRSRTRELWD